MILPYILKWKEKLTQTSLNNNKVNVIVHRPYSVIMPKYILVNMMCNYIHIYSWNIHMQKENQ